MDRIHITDDPNEMEAIGRELFVEHEKLYTERVTGMIRSTIDELSNELSFTEKQRLFYTSIYDYWVYGVNIGEDLYFHFPNKTHDEKSGYLTCKNRQAYYNHLNNPNDTHVFRNKYETYERFKDYFRRDVIQICSPMDFVIFEEFVKKHPTFVVKPTDLSCAVGVHRDTVRPDEQIKDTFSRLCKEINNVYEKAYWGKAHTFVIEELINQSAALSILHPNSVNAVRCTTVNVNGAVQIFYPWLKIGSGGADIASAAIGGIDAGIDPVTGHITTPAYDEKLRTYDVHPDTGIAFRNYQIPCWNELLATVTNLAKSIPTVRYIGWDMVLTEEGWVVMEGNDGGEFLGQLMWGRGFKREFQELIHWGPKSAFWWE